MNRKDYRIVSPINPQMIQLLEPRQMMSLTAPPPLMPQPVPVVSAPGGLVMQGSGMQADNSTQINAGLNDLSANLQWMASPFPTAWEHSQSNASPAFSAGSPDDIAAGTDALETEPVHAIAEGSPFTVATTHPGPAGQPLDARWLASPSTLQFTAATTEPQTFIAETAVTQAAAPTSISALYSTLETSTVSQIDNAAASETFDRLAVNSSAGPDAAAFLNLSALITTGSAIQGTQGVGTGLLLANFATATLSGAQLTAPASIIDSDDLHLLDREQENIQIPTPQAVNPIQVSTSLLSREHMLNLEKELLAIRAYSNDLAWTLQRDQAIATAHAQDGSLLSSQTDRHLSSMSHWTSTTEAIGVAIATIVYAQSKIVRARTNLGPVFSSTPLRNFIDG